jgi:hypothetical protein
MEALHELSGEVRKEIFTVLEELDDGTRDRGEVLENDTHNKYHFFTLEIGTEEYTVVVELDRHFDEREDEIEVVNAGCSSDFIL